mmetsp:Transcript_51371/g.94962  ORF Transcript_51371/g.94962 Transcript_51371/m.94962 type:complete len:206 (+) Transcript_51371:208-825(+)
MAALSRSTIISLTSCSKVSSLAAMHLLHHCCSITAASLGSVLARVLEVRRSRSSTGPDAEPVIGTTVRANGVVLRAATGRHNPVALQNSRPTKPRQILWISSAADSRMTLISSISTSKACTRASRVRLHHCCSFIAASLGSLAIVVTGAAGSVAMVTDRSLVSWLHHDWMPTSSSALSLRVGLTTSGSNLQCIALLERTPLVTPD